VRECFDNSSCQNVGDVALRISGGCLNDSGLNIPKYVRCLTALFTYSTL